MPAKPAVPVPALNTAKSLAWKKAGPAERRALLSLQGNILKGHGRPLTWNLFFQFGSDKAASRRFLRELGDYHVTDALTQLEESETFKREGVPGGPFTGLALSAAGYKALGIAAKETPPDKVFAAGMKKDTALGDPAVSEWEAPFSKDIHGMVLVGDVADATGAEKLHAIVELLEAAGGTALHVQRGRALKNAAGDGIEHFGYVDGRSQPLLLEEDQEVEPQSRWDAAFPLDLALVPDPGAPDGQSFGSYFVFRKLEQDVASFKTREQELATALGLTGEDRELAGALCVGRFEDGTPVTMSRTPRGLEPPNDFTYKTDPGSRCPFHAHIRKANPRGTGGAEAEAVERRHLMPRRGIPFEDTLRTVHPDGLPEADTFEEFKKNVLPLLPTGGVGLLFMAYNSDISRQFQFTQKQWVNSTAFPFGTTSPQPGQDPVIGQNPAAPGTPGSPQHWPNTWDAPGGGRTDFDFHGFVRMKGGEYFFTPSITFLKNL